MRKLSLLALIVLPLTARAVTVSTADGAGKDVDVLTLSDGKVSGGPLDGMRTEDLVQIVFAPTASGSGKVEVRLLSGDSLWGSLGASRAPDTLTLDTPALGTVTVKLEQVRSIIYAEKLQGAALAALEDRVETDRAKMDHDLCYLTGGDRVRFYVRSADEKSVKGEDDDHRAYEFPIAQVQALSLMSTAKPPAADGVQARVTARDGSVLIGGLSAIQDSKLALAHPLLGTLSVPVDRIAVVDVLGGRVLSLSDLDPTEVKEMPFLYDPTHPAEATIFHYRKDRQVIDGRPILLRGRPYAQGFGVHSYCELSFDLGGGYARFRSDVGIDDSAKGGGNAEAVVKVDGKECFRARITGKDQPQPVDVDCRGAKRLTLIVDFGENREILDRAVWASPVLVKAK